MSDGEAPGANPAVSGAARRAGASPGRRIEFLIVGLVILGALGVGVTNYSPLWGFRYWVAMVPVFGAVCGIVSWARVRARGETLSGPVRRQALHWLGLLAAVGLIYLLTEAGRMADTAAGPVALHCLALTTFLAGVHTDWRISLVGGLLGGVVLALALVEYFAWILLLLAAAAALLAVWVWRRSAGAKAQ